MMKMVNPCSSQGSLENSGRVLQSENEKIFFDLVVPKKYMQASLENCERQPKILIDFAKEWAIKPVSVFFFGGCGTGKTYFTFAMIREMFRTCPVKLWPRYFTSPELDSKLLQASKSEEGDAWVIRDIAEQDILFIDDFGRETKSDRLKRQYFEILNYRYVNELPTILTSNYNINDLGEILDKAVASRMQEWEAFHFKGKDMRKEKPSKIVS